LICKGKHVIKGSAGIVVVLLLICPVLPHSLQRYNVIIIIIIIIITTTTIMIIIIIIIIVIIIVIENI